MRFVLILITAYHYSTALELVEYPLKILHDTKILRKLTTTRSSIYSFNYQLIYVSVFFSTIGLRLSRTLNFGWVKLNMSFFDKGGE